MSKKRKLVDVDAETSKRQALITKWFQVGQHDAEAGEAVVSDNDDPVLTLSDVVPVSRKPEASRLLDWGDKMWEDAFECHVRPSEQSTIENLLSALPARLQVLYLRASDETMAGLSKDLLNVL